MLITTLMWKFHFLLKKFAPPPESFAPENLEGAPPEKFFLRPPLMKKIPDESQHLTILRLTDWNETKGSLMDSRCKLIVTSAIWTTIKQTSQW